MHVNSIARTNLSGIFEIFYYEVYGKRIGLRLLLSNRKTNQIEKRTPFTKNNMKRLLFFLAFNVMLSTFGQKVSFDNYTNWNETLKAAKVSWEQGFS